MPRNSREDEFISDMKDTGQHFSMGRSEGISPYKKSKEFGSADAYGENFGSSGDNFGKGPKGYKRSDLQIKEDICEKLYRDPYIDASDIEVKVQAGTVILEGTIEDQSVKKAVEDCVSDVTGVNEIKNLLNVRVMKTNNHF